MKTPDRAYQEHVFNRLSAAAGRDGAGDAARAILDRVTADGYGDWAAWVEGQIVARGLRNAAATAADQEK